MMIRGRHSVVNYVFLSQAVACSAFDKGGRRTAQNGTRSLYLLFHDGFPVFLPGQDASEEVDDVVALLCQQGGGKSRPLAAAAVDGYDFILLE